MPVLTPLQLQHNLAQLEHTIAAAAQQFERNLDDIFVSVFYKNGCKMNAFDG